MALEVTVGPPRLAISHGYGVLITEPDGQIPWPTDKGFYDSDTRMISSWQIFADGQPWNLLNSGNIAYYANEIFLANAELNTFMGKVPAGTISMTVGRTIGGGIHEDIDLVNHNQFAVQFNLEIALRSDFADLFEVKSGQIVRRGLIRTDWSAKRGVLKTSYDNDTFQRELTLRCVQASCDPVYANGRLSFLVELAPGQAWHTCLLYEIVSGRGKSKAIRRPPAHCIGHHRKGESADRLAVWHKSVTTIETSNEEFYRFYRQSVDDMAGLRLPIEGTDDVDSIPAAGVPWFLALFGRDTLLVSLQTAMVHHDFAHGALKVLGDLQARVRDDYRDAEPGKILHEMRRGELAHFKLIPHTPYYGTADATILYLIVLHEAWRCTGDLEMVREFLPVAERCLNWIDNYGDRDGDGFQEYETRSPAGMENMGWKDSGESMVYVDGSFVKGPKALCELQGYVYDAWLRMAFVYEALNKPRKAAALRVKAERLFERFNAAFWDEKAGFYALCLDGEKKPVMSIASNAGHLLWSGIVPEDRAERVVRRLMESDMWSGWGIRTLSAKHPAFNPNSYQNGSVWPHDNALIALGFRRYGFTEEANRVARDISGAAGYFAFHQMPELYSGLQRDPSNFPVQYLGANVPQAWAAGSAFHTLQMMLGFQPDAPGDRLYIDPALPDWMTKLSVMDLKVGAHRFDIDFWCEGAETLFEVTKGDASRVSRRAYTSGSERKG